MKTRYLNFALLALALAVSFFSVLTFTTQPDLYTEGRDDTYRLLIPGVVYSIFIIWVVWSKGDDYPPHKLILLFPVLIILYFASVVCGLQSWGFGVPVIGGVGAVLIQAMFYWKHQSLEQNSKVFAVLGSVSGLAGFLLYTWARKCGFEGVGCGCILVTWQLAFGIKWILLKNSFVDSQ